MGVSTDNHFARTDKTFFWQNNVFNAHSTYFKVVRNAMFAYEVAHYLSLSSRLNIFIRCEMIRHQVDFMAIKYRFANLQKLFTSRWECDVVHQYRIQMTFNDLAWFYNIKTRVASHILFSNGHTHFILPPVVLAP